VDFDFYFSKCLENQIPPFADTRMGGAHVGMSKCVPADPRTCDRTPALFQQNQHETGEARSVYVNWNLTAAGRTRMLFNISHLAKAVFFRRLEEAWSRNRVNEAA
jgi:hypothetical protein